MISVSEDLIKKQADNMFSVVRSGAAVDFTEEKFLRKLLPVLLEERMNKPVNKGGLKFPYDVKIPKSIPDMLKGDFEPAKVLHIEKPFECEWGPMWFGSTTEGIKLRYGNVNGDSRYPSQYELGDKIAHGIMAGTTGSGKSVALNTVIYGACMEYPPWELNLILSDAKIVEFKTIAKNNYMPHIKVIAATGDADYLASVVRNKYEEMQKLNSVFTKASEVFHQDVKNIMDFKKVTGLSYPRTLLIFDEFQTMFAGAGKQLQNLIKDIDLFARLGRNTGYHLYLTSQELGSDVPKATLNNIGLRGALGCTASVSEAIIGNDAAKVNNGLKGKLIVNTKADLHNPEDNVNIRIPFCNPANVRYIADTVMDLGKKLGMEAQKRFYDEQSVIYESQEDEYLGKFKKDESRIILGEPSFLTDAEEQCVDIKFAGEGNENVIVLSSVNKHLCRYFSMIKHNLQTYDCINFGLLAENAFKTAGATTDFFGDFLWDDASIDSEFFELAKSLIYKRKLCLEIDKHIFDLKDSNYNDQTDAVFYSIFEQNSVEDTELNRCRCYQVFQIVYNSPLFKKVYPTDAESMQSLVKDCILNFVNCNCTNKRITIKNYKPYYFWILGLNKVLGLGRDCKSKNVEALKQQMQDSTQVNIRFIVLTTNVEDTSDLRNGSKYAIFDHPNFSDISRMKVSDFYPNTVSNVLGVFIDMDDKEHPLKFKKMFFDDELIGG